MEQLSPSRRSEPFTTDASQRPDASPPKKETRSLFTAAIANPFRIVKDMHRLTHIKSGAANSQSFMSRAHG